VKLVALWLGVLGLAAIAAGSCSVNHRSGDFACETAHDCADGRTCSDGFCVGLPLDAGAKTDAQLSGDAGQCPSQCTSCTAATKTCVVDCALNGGCKQRVACPAGWNCNVACSVANACNNGVVCTGDTACKITCSGAQSCRTITCATGPCNVDCPGNGSCRDVTCDQACSCDVACDLNSACNTTTCPSASCDSPSVFGGCTSLTPGCNTCP
jgi:hypothetical protein